MLLVLVACDRPGVDSSTSPDYVVVYTSVDESALVPLYDGFTEATGVRIQQVSGEYERLIEMMHDKQWRPAADIFLADDAATLGNAAQESIFRPTYSEAIEQAVPARYRDPDHLFNAIATRANAIVVDKSGPGMRAPERYESLAEPEWKGKLCLTSSAKPENIAWVSLLLARHGKREAEMIVRRMIGNLATPVFEEQSELAAAVESGRCGVAIADLQTIVLHLSGHVGGGIGIILPSAESGGVQVDIIGAGVTRHAANPEDAVRFLEWLASDDGQRAVVRSGAGFPVSAAVEMGAPLGEYRQVPPAEINVSQLAALSTDAIALVERAHYP